MANAQVTSTTVMFADISGSVSMYASLGDATASAVVSEALWLMGNAAGAHQGTVVETRGDEVLCTFDEPDHGLAAAIAMQRAMTEQLPSRNSDTPAGFGLHIGMHYGEVLLEDQQLFGDTVNRAARVRSLAKRGQILLSSAVHTQLSDTYTGQLRFLDEVILRGQNQSEPVYEYIWRTDATMIGLRPTRMRATRREHLVSAELRLRHGDTDVGVGAHRPQVTIGRGDAADIMTDDHMASREHAYIEQRRDRFVLTDMSTNGTFVERDGKVHFVHRDECELSGEGRISAGRDFDDAIHVIEFVRESR